MQVKKILKGKEVKEIEEMIEKNYGCRIKLNNLFLTNDNKVWIAGHDIDLSFATELKRCYRIGLYFGRLKRNKKIKLSIEGAMIVGKRARKNIVVLEKDEAQKFANGEDIKNFEEVEAETNNFVIVKMGEDVIGVGIKREGYIENLIPKARRIKI